MSAYSGLAQALKIPVELDEEEGLVAISSLIASACSEPDPAISLQDIYSAVSSTASAGLLDPLSTLPRLLPCRNQAAKDILSLMGECGSSKEIIIVVQEAVERLEQDCDMEQEDVMLSYTEQLITLSSLYTSAIPRLGLRQRTAEETISPLLTDLGSAINTISAYSTKDESRALISSISSLAISVYKWVESVSADSKARCQGILRTLLDTVLLANSRFIDSSVSQRTFEKISPRMNYRSSPSDGWENGEKAVTEAADAYSTLGFQLTTLTRNASVGSLIILAHASQPPILSSSVFAEWLPTLLSSLQGNIAIDEALAFLLHNLTLNATLSPAPPEVLIPLIHVLSPLASSHPDPSTRYITFRILALALKNLPSLVRLQALHNLASDPEFPQMRVASVGLVKEAFLEALSLSTRSDDNVFLAPVALQTLGPILFRPDPPDLFSDNVKVKMLLDPESSEPARLVECLSFYYVLLRRDAQNKTRIRDPDVLKNVEDGLLNPLRAGLKHLGQNNLIALGALQIGLERIDTAIAALKV